MLGHGLILAEPLDVSLSVKECGLGLLAATSGGGEAIVGERAPLLGVTMADAWRLAQSWPWLREGGVPVLEAAKRSLCAVLPHSLIDLESNGSSSWEIA
jgi:hypothetical protein